MFRISAFSSSTNQTAGLLPSSSFSTENFLIVTSRGLPSRSDAFSHFDGIESRQLPMSLPLSHPGERVTRPRPVAALAVAQQLPALALPLPLLGLPLEHTAQTAVPKHVHLRGA